MRACMQMAAMIVLIGNVFPTISLCSSSTVCYMQTRQQTDTVEIFRQVERAILVGMPDEFIRYFAGHVQINVRGSEGGHYSANQAYFVLQNFFNNHKPLSFTFTTYGESGGVHYATGRGSINVKGNREFIQVYVSLAKQKGKWVITQFNIY